MVVKDINKKNEDGTIGTISSFEKIKLTPYTGFKNDTETENYRGILLHPYSYYNRSNWVCVWLGSNDNDYVITPSKTLAKIVIDSIVYGEVKYESN